MSVGATHSSVFLKQGVWGCSSPEVKGLLVFKYKNLPNACKLAIKYIDIHTNIYI